MDLNFNEYELVGIDDVKKNECKTEKIFYDLEIEDDNSFFISDGIDKILVHNCDGYHIKSLLINFFHTFFPELLKQDFVYEFVTPILRISYGNKKKYFYKLKDFNDWKKKNEISNYKSKYYKGLGTIEKDEIKLFFKDIDKHLIKFHYTEEEKTNDIIDLAFRKKRSDDRKEWLLNYIPNKVVDKFNQKTTYVSFFNDEFIEFSMEDNIRSIPSIMDGLKPSHRKILYTLFKMGSNNEMNVGEIFGYVKATANYVHGPAGLEQAIISLAQNFINSNNLSLLEPLGQFGTRLSGGKDAASARYIYTKLRNITKFIFISDDNDILNYKNEEGKQIEPEYYLPIIPIILLNGTEGIGTGWSTYVPKFKIEDLIDYLLNKLNNKRKNIELHPYFELFKGDIIYNPENNVYISKGIIQRINNTTLNITELPIGIWNDSYYQILDKMIDDKIIKSYIKNCTDDNVDIKIKMTKETLDDISSDDYETLFQLISKINLTNMHLFDSNLKIKKYNTQYEIIDEYYNERIKYFEKRKQFILNNLNHKKVKIENIIKFIELVLSNKIVINNKKLEDIINKFIAYDILKMENSFDYLLNIPLYKLTKEQYDKLINEHIQLLNEIKKIEDTSSEKMWIDDLNNLKKEIKKHR